MRKVDAFTADGKHCGTVYLDLFSRPGKHAGSALFVIQCGKMMADGTYRSPTVALVGNLTPMNAINTNMLLEFGEAETLFHEFGHLMHAYVLT